MANPSGSLPPATSQSEQVAQLAGSGPLGNERIIEYGTFTTDAFADYRTREVGSSDAQLDGTGGPNKIDGFDNDDSYRRSRHLLRGASERARLLNEENLRENSLARQLSQKRDQPATIRLIRRRKMDELADLPAGEQRVPWVNLIPPNTKFFLEQVSESREEKVQVIDTFGEWVAFFFGRKPEVYSYSGTLLNAKNHDWKNEFQDNYDNYLRGSQAVKHRATMILQYDDVMVEGYMMNCSISQNAMADKSVPFQFTLLVINRSSMNPRATTGMRLQRSGGSALEFAMFDTLQASLDLTQDGKTDELETFLLMREYFSGNYVPAAGIAEAIGAGVKAGASTQPGATSGTTNAKRSPSAFEPAASAALDNTSVQLGDIKPPAPVSK